MVIRMGSSCRSIKSEADCSVRLTLSENYPPIVSQPEWTAAREKMLVKGTASMRADDALTGVAIIDLEFRDATNLDTHPIHFHSTKWQIVDANHLVQGWYIAAGQSSMLCHT